MPPTTILATLIDESYNTLPGRNWGEIVTEVEWLCDQTAALILSADGGDAPVQADMLRAQAIGVLWAAGLHRLHAESWADVTIEAILLDHTM